MFCRLEVRLILMNNLSFESIDKFSLEECKLAKLSNQEHIMAIKQRLMNESLSEEMRFDLEKKRRHLGRLSFRIDKRILVLKEELRILKDKLQIQAEENRHANDQLIQFFRPRAYHAVFCYIAHELLDTDTIEMIESEVKQRIKQLKEELEP